MSAQEIVTKGGEKLYKVETEKEIDELYRHHQILSDADQDAGNHIESYKYILNAVRTGQERAKVLACQFIPKFFKYFDKLASQAINAMLDLCEEESRTIRLNAIKGLPLLCQEKKEHVKTIANVLCQLLIEEDKVESDIIKNAFIQLFKIDSKAALTSLFEQIENVEQEDAKAREQAIVFLKERVMPLASELITTNPDAEHYIATEIQKLLATASEKEFADFLNILQNLSMYNDENGKKLLLNIVAAQSPLSGEYKYDPKDVTTLKRVLNLVHIVAPLLSSLKQNGPFFKFLTVDVMPRIEELEDQLRLDVLRSVSVESASASAPDARQAIGVIYQKLMDNIPLKQADSTTEPELNFSYLECYLYSFHQLAQKVPGILNSICGIKIVTGQPGDDMRDYSEKRNNMVQRLQYLEQRCSTYKKALIEVLKKNREAEAASENNTAEQSGEKSVEEPAKPTISTEQAQSTMRIIKNLLKMSGMLSKKQPVFCKSDSIYLSWIEYQGKKRTAPSSDDQPAEKRQRKHYSHEKEQQQRRPSGSSSRGSQRGGSRGGRGGRGGRGRGGFRGGRRNN